MTLLKKENEYLLILREEGRKSEEKLRRKKKTRAARFPNMLSCVGYSYTYVYKASCNNDALNEHTLLLIMGKRTPFAMTFAVLVYPIL